MWLFYRALSALVLAVVGPFVLLLRGRLGGGLLRGRLARNPPRPPPGPAIWIHAVSVGEAMVAATLARGLPEDLPLVVTTVTPTGQERARRDFAGRAEVGWFPFEIQSAVGRFFDAVRPRLLVLVEGDYWPLVLREARRRGCPVVVVNGRVSDRSFARLRRLPRALLRIFFGGVDRFALQTSLDRDRLAALGVPTDRLEVTGNLKFEATDPPRLDDLDRWVERLAGGRPILVAGSTMAGEERALVDAFASTGDLVDALLVVAPRHPERFDEVHELLRERFPSVARRSTPDEGAGAAPSVALLDTLGELAALYRHARGAFIGGTLRRTGGHNPLEAARFGVPVAAGPSMENFREIAESFDRADAWVRVSSAAALASTWQRWLLDPSTAAVLGRRGRDLVEAGRGSLDRTRRLLEPFLPEAVEVRS